MKVFLHEIASRPRDLHFDRLEPWAATVLETLDESAFRGQRPFRANFEFHHADGVYIVQGDLHTRLRLLCSRCGQDFEVPIDEGFSALFSTDPETAGVAYLAGKNRAPQQQNHGYARHAHDFEADATDLKLGQADLDITYLNEETIDLAAILSEQVQLQIPFQPLCNEACKGLCPECGANLNLGRCACDRIKRESPFSVLKVKEQ